MAQKYAFLIDAERCIFCRACVVACKLENHVGSQWQRNDVILIGPDQTKNPAMYPVFMNCQHCERPACMMTCPHRALDFGLRDELLARVKREGREILDIDKFGMGPSNIILKPRPVRMANALNDPDETYSSEWPFDIKAFRVGASEELNPG